MIDEPIREELAVIPKLGETRDIPSDERKIYLHFFIGSCHWYLAEFDGDNCFWGYIGYSDLLPDTGWTLFSFFKLRTMKVDGYEVICDPYWKPKPFGKRPIDLIDVELPHLTLTCSNCKSTFTEQLQLIIAYIKIHPNETPCCNEKGEFEEKETVNHIKALLSAETLKINSRS